MPYNRLTIPFAHTVVISEALPKSFAKQYCAKNIVTYKGVDEVAWIKDFKPKKITGLKKPLIVIRTDESKAAYAGEKKTPPMCLRKSFQIWESVLIERYNGKGKAFGDKEGFVDSRIWGANADLVIGNGGTIGREAALQGFPSIGITDMAKTNVNRYLAERASHTLLLRNEASWAMQRSILANALT